jgi:putative nucleotidyltransferase with HDIG domain
MSASASDAVRAGVVRAGLSRTLSLAGCAAAAVWFALVADERVLDPLTLLLAAGAVVANLASIRYEGPLWVSASFTCSMLAVALLGPAAAFVVAAVGELGAWAFERFRPAALAINTAASAIPNLLAATLFAALAPGGERASELQVGLALVLVAAAALTVNYLIVGFLTALEDGERVLARLHPPRALLPPLVWTVLVTMTVVLVYRHMQPLGAAVFGLVAVGVVYMLQLLAAARQRTEQYAALSWGVLSGLMRTLDERDPREARHAAAVASFARDIARASGMSARDCELAHTVGLLHDIGKFALSDRALFRKGSISHADWATVRRHPELGADMLCDLGIYGPVAELIRAHHERLDGHGYPDGLAGDEIPPIARIVAVAEVYDTLTAQDSYREHMSSFEALNELRRVSGTQLDGACVETLARVLAGRATDYRHADVADFSAELDLERRLAEAATL